MTKKKNMNTILESFHVELGLFLAQIVNFAIVFSVLYYFVIRPIMKVMGERTQKIEDSLKHAKEVEEKLKKTEEDYDKKIAEAHKEATRIINEATEKAQEKKEKMIKKAKDEIGAIITKEKEGIMQQKEKTMKELQSEVSGIVMGALEKVLEEKLNEKEDRKLIEKIVKENN
ncbi:ATP synthase F0 subunit B [Candidatus Parcubacteria bacterium]|nr:MAG: ATP synthase F0 subunit B [Candidatus Parcubacteria bacterium]